MAAFGILGGSLGLTVRRLVRRLLVVGFFFWPPCGRLAVALPVARASGAGRPLAVLRRAGFLRRDRCGRARHPGNGLSDQALDSTDGLAVDWRHDRDCRARAAGAAGPAD